MLSTTEAAYLAGIIDGEGTITLTKMHHSENRRPIISIASTEKELLTYIQKLIGGYITNKKNYKPSIHKDSFVLTIKKKQNIFTTLEGILPFLRIASKKKRAAHILEKYDLTTPRNGKYTTEALALKHQFEEEFFAIK
ncbi:LAGLIDADG family homing endonuclease [Halalkalibacter alkalisediminis]|uniref:LAGLIDADG family homing endonuclease n=1 Tax=Halalkalibacter alkalisediminis TaxID=935616 RepID=A0ABV6NFG0_9BACI|nr:LAGLIDADG family homing endonuclease [Halalkalibacter alkalisediminis]